MKNLTKTVIAAVALYAVSAGMASAAPGLLMSDRAGTISRNGFLMSDRAAAPRADGIIVTGRDGFLVSD